MKASKAWMKTWTMNCVLLGAKVRKLLDEGKEDEARQHLKELTSEFEPEDIDYLLFRLREKEEADVQANKRGTQG